MVAHYTLTLTGSAQSLASVLPTYVAASAPSPGEQVSVSFLSLQAAGGNSGLIYVGGSGQVLTSSAYGFRMEIPISTIPSAPNIVELGGGASIRLSEWQVLGTSNDILHILVKD